MPLPIHTYSLPINTFNMINLECQCCFDEPESGNDMVWCSKGHSICNTCIKIGVEHAIAEIKPLFTCPFINKHDGQVCGEEFHRRVLSRAIQDAHLIERFEFIQARRDVLAALQTEDDLVFDCQFCDNIIVLEEPALYVECECGRATCCTCKQDAHQGPCTPEEEHDQDENETNNFVLTCTCGNRFIRGDGCNHVICNQCQEHWCWICKTTLDRETPYHHFGNPNATCPLYGERGEPWDPLQQPPLEDVQGIDDGLMAIQEAMQHLQQIRHDLGFINPEMLNVLQVIQQVPQVELQQDQVFQRVRCEALTLRGTQCQFHGQFEGRCRIHRDRFRFYRQVNA